MVVDRVTQIRVGIFVSSALLLSMLIIFLIGSSRSWFEQKYTLHCTFDVVSGVGPGASVSLAGMRVGSVKAVGFSADPNRADVIIDLEISKQFQERIRGDSRASIVTQGLLGDKMIMVSVGTPSFPALQSGDQLMTEAAGDLAGLGQSAEGLIKDGKRVLQQVSTLLNDLQTGDGVVHALIYDREGAATVRDFAASARAVRALAERINREVDLAAVRHTIANFRSTSNEVRAIVSGIRRGEGSIGGLLSDSAIYEDIRGIFGKTNRNALVKSMIRSMLREQETPK